MSTLMLVLYGAISITTTILFEFFFEFASPFDSFIVYLPSDFKAFTSMNWFGCIVCFIVLFLITPYSFIFKYFVKFFYWLFHIHIGWGV